MSDSLKEDFIDLLIVLIDDHVRVLGPGTHQGNDMYVVYTFT